MSLGINLACALRSTPTAVRRGALAHPDTMLVARWLPRQPLEMARVVLNTSYTETCTINARMLKRAPLARLGVASQRPQQEAWALTGHGTSESECRDRTVYLHLY